MLCLRKKAIPYIKISIHCFQHMLIGARIFLSFKVFQNPILLFKQTGIELSIKNKKQARAGTHTKWHLIQKTRNPNSRTGHETSFKYQNPNHLNLPKPPTPKIKILIEAT